MHVDGSSTCSGGLSIWKASAPTEKQLHAALEEAGFDFVHNVLVQASAAGAHSLAKTAKASDSRPCRKSPRRDAGPVRA